jgi:GT2 family glycosyltransferase
LREDCTALNWNTWPPGIWFDCKDSQDLQHSWDGAAVCLPQRPVEMSGSEPKEAAVEAIRPLASVVVGNFNQAPFVEQAIRSVAGQSFRDFECVVVDDGSTDDSPERISTCLSDLGDPRFRFIRRETNGGQMVAMLTGLDATSAPFVAFLDGDDYWSPEFLDRHIGAHRSRARAAAVSSSDSVLVDTDGRILAGGLPNFRKGDPRRPGARAKALEVTGEGQDMLVFIDSSQGGWLWSVTSGMVFRRIAIEAMRPANPEELRVCADGYLARAAHMLGGTVRLERVLGSYRLHGGNAWANSRFFGGGIKSGCVPPAVAEAVQSALLKRFCEVAPKLETAIDRNTLSRALIAQAGWVGALDLRKSNPEARVLLDDWTTARQKLTLRLGGLMMRVLRPRRIADRP